MAKYNYDKKALKGYGVGPFLGEVKTRVAHIEAAAPEEIQTIYNANILAAKLHPHFQMAVIEKVVDYPNAKAFVLAPFVPAGFKQLAYFRAGQYVSTCINFPDGTLTTKPYTLAGSPKDALGDETSRYTIFVKKTEPGFASKFILENWKPGMPVGVTGPLGNFYYQELRDAKNVVAACGGSGITPFISMAAAIADGIEDFNLTILYGTKKENEIAFKAELDEIAARSNGKVKIVHVLSDEKKDGYENGFITADLIKKYAGKDDYSLFVCGPKAFYKFMHGVVEELGLPKRRTRFELAGEYGDPAQSPAYNGDPNAEYKVKLVIRGEEQTITCKGNETLVSAIQRNGVLITTDCRSGECGWCHSRLISGNVFIPEEADGRREASKKFGWIHPCVSYPLSDIELEVFPILMGKK